MRMYNKSFGTAKSFVVFLVLVEGWISVSMSLALPSPERQRMSQHNAIVQESDRRMLLNSWPRLWGNQFNVLTYGAKGDGQTCDTKAFELAWLGACTYAGGVMVVPAGYVFLVGPIMFKGPCSTNTLVQVDGTILSMPSNSTEWLESKKIWWLKFVGLNGLTIMGSGLINGNGASWWCNSCRRAEVLPKRCRAPTAVKITQSTNVVVKEVTIQNAAQAHLVFETCSRVLVKEVKVIAPEDSPNTDGISFADTQKATVEYSEVSTGDDCVSIKSGSFDIIIHHFKCGPGAGISIGSLGAKGTTSCVSNINVYNVTVENASGAVRMKTWQGGSGYVSKVSFENIRVRNVSHPVVIDQYYCDTAKCRNHATKAVAISDVKFRNIVGSYDPSYKAVSLACSEKVPCTGISMVNVNLWPIHGSRTSPTFKGGSFCHNAYGSVDGYSSTVGIEDCLSTPSDIWWKSALTANRLLCPRF
ncbi:protein MpGH28.4 [Marchantia polymorpha subsp. ruderalis]|uniref:Polygalacturonase n=2 Tax=Marchantia polymorpha TaxID=3197 RepID=A0AAF6B353_MARPO|nr:hypothetical protein MARPO_0160s0009 [Marchantia polymorpha]BBN06437.1 hypothetical protein Mp_3g21140 [Marchantia polymorpha subsp. ruderalis]|eukprot:PTQ28557.1 hypothetical protein MARPO_0160s0009 [Marchantia polymorpha]